MNNFSTKALEFDRFIEFLAGYASSQPGQEAVCQVGPQRNQQLSKSLQECIGDGVLLLKTEATLPSVRFFSLDDQLARVAPEGAILAPDDFILIKDVLDCGIRVRRFLCSDSCSEFNRLAAFGERMPTFEDLLQHISNVFADDGEIQDRASSKLGEIRRDISRFENRIRNKLDSLISSNAMESVLQEKYVAIRNNRFVVPIRRETRSQLRGVVHDQSNSGRTLFVEPEGVVEQSNELAAAKLEERDEIRRILQKLSTHVRRVSKEFGYLTADLINYDCIRAISSWAHAYECTQPLWGKSLNLKSARHPLLQAQFRDENKEEFLVPLNMPLTNDLRVLAITGSNTGGKTVVLKTVGLLQLIGQSGLPIPADDGSTLVRFESILADIGDDQSIQQNLSTFSSHLTHVRDILDISSRQTSLILLDELGSGTDPAEGAALGSAILSKLAERSCLTLITTHLAAIKHYVHESPQMMNGAVLFNKETLTPEYTLELGRPGASHAMTIARSLGLQEEVLTKAEEFLNRDELRLEKLLAQMDAEHQKLHRNLIHSERARETIESKQHALSEELDELRRERKKILNRAQREAASIVDNSKREMESLIKKAGNNLSNDDIATLRGKAGRKQKALHQNIEETRDRPSAPLDPATVAVGDRVWAASLNDHGTIESISGNGKRVKITVNGMVFDVKTRDLGQADAVEDQATKRVPSVAVSKPRNASSGKTELKLLGLRVEEGIKELEKFIDTAALSGLHQVRIVHGFGTGAMRIGVHEYLASCPVIKGFRVGRPDKDEGGAGVTWVELK